MTDDAIPVWTRAEIASPCVRVCVVHPQAKICIGCYRTMEEIRDWSRYSHEERRTVMDDLEARAPLVRETGLAKRRARRAARSNDTDG